MTTTTQTIGTTIDLPATLYGRYSPKKGLVVRPNLPEGTTTDNSTFRRLSDAEVNGLYDLLETEGNEKYVYLMDKLAAGKTATFGNRKGRENKLLEPARKITNV